MLVPLLCFAVGCGKRKKDPKEEKKPERPIVQSVQFNGGDTTVYASSAANAPAMFSLKWKQGGFQLSKSGFEKGNLRDLSGQLFDKGKPAATYTAGRGDADQELRRLNLTEGVEVRTLDGRSTIDAAAGEYRPDQRLVRATGGVVAKGPFGTLSGVPELWTTPDFNLLGTPDMASQMLKIPALAALAATATLGSPTLQNGKSYTVTGWSSLGGVAIKSGKTTTGYRVTAKPRPGGTIVLTMPENNLTIRTTGTLVILTDAKGQNVRSLTTQGTVNAVQAVAGSRTTLDGTSLDYEIQPGAATGTAEVGGRVTITNLQNSGGEARTVVGKGDRGTAILIAKPAGGANPLRSATLNGNVQIDVKGGTGSYAGTGDRLVYTPSGKNARAVMTGNLKFTGDAPAFLGDVSEADTAVVNLSESGWEDVELTNSGGRTTTTTIQTKPGGKKGDQP